MISLQTVLLFAGFLVLCAAAGFVAAATGEFSARRGAEAARRGRPVTVPVLVGSGDGQHRGRAFVDGDDVVVIGPGTHLRIGRQTFRDAGERRATVNEDLLEFAEQRGFVDASGQRHLVGAVEEWSDALDAQLDGPSRRAVWWRRVRAAVPVTPLGFLLLAVVGLVAFQGLWAAGRDVQATMVRTIDHPEEGYVDCAVRWPAEPEGVSSVERPDHYAEIDCYEPYPATGDPVRIRALAAPFEGRALDHEGTFEALTAFTAGPALLSLLVMGGVAVTRLRRPAIRLARTATPDVTFAAPVEVAHDADLLHLLDALAVREGWNRAGSSTPPSQPAYAPLLMAVGSARWWPVAVLGAGAFLVDLPGPWRYGLVAGAVVALAWALVCAVGTWLAVRRAYAGPVTSEWDYRLIRTIDDEWCALLNLGRTPHWMVFLDGPQHPPTAGRCGVRGDLVEGGAIHLRIGEAFWPTVSPVMRVDDDALADMAEDVTFRLRGTGRE